MVVRISLGFKVNNDASGRMGDKCNVYTDHIYIYVSDVMDMTYN